MDPITVAFEMTDAVAARAARAEGLRQGRQLLEWRTLGLVAFSAIIFVFALQGDDVPWWWLVLTGAAPVLYGLLVTGWLVLLWWFPRATRRRLVRLPHRNVSVELTDTQLVFQTASERLAVSWSEVKELRELTDFWIACLQSGAQIPIPKEALPSDAVALAKSKLDRALSGA